MICFQNDGFLTRIKVSGWPPSVANRSKPILRSMVINQNYITGMAESGLLHLAMRICKMFIYPDLHDDQLQRRDAGAITVFRFVVRGNDGAGNA